MSTSNLGTIGHIPRVLVIVDSRNIVGQAERALGVPAHPSVAGIIDGLKPYGIDVASVHVALAIPRPRDRPKLKGALQANEQFKTEVERHPLGNTLVGELHAHEQPDGSLYVTEKMVDTLCAVEIVRRARDIVDGQADYEAVVVLSQDIDLTPAYRYADELGVPVYAAATDTVDTRTSHHPRYILLPPDVLGVMCPDPNGHPRGHDLRRQLAVAIKSQGRSEWEPAPDVVVKNRSRILRNDEGLLGIANPGRDSARRTWPRKLRPYNVDFAADHRFPYAICKTGAPQKGDRQLRTATLQRWLRPGKALVEMGNGSSAQLDRLPIGYLTPGTTLLISEAKGRRYIGPLEEPKSLVARGSDRPLETRHPVTATVKSLTGPGKAICQTSDGTIGLLFAGRNVELTVGSRYAATHVGVTKSGRAKAVLHLLSSGLP